MLIGGQGPSGLPARRPGAFACLAQRRASLGVGLIELLVALLLLSVGMAGFAGLQAASMKNASMAQHRAVAMQLATELSERIKANASANGDVQKYAVTAPYASPQAGTPTEAGTGCTGPAADCGVQAMAMADLDSWRWRLSQLLPAAAVKIKPSPADGALDLTIAWRDPAMRAGEQMAATCPADWVDNQPDVRCLSVRVTR